MSYRSRYKNDPKVRIFDAIVDGIKSLFRLSVRKIPIRNHQALDNNFIKNKWQEITELVHLGGPSRFKQAIIEADKLFDLALKNSGVEGENMGMRLKNAKNKFDWSVYQGIWQAHKVRNEIVHESDRELLSHEAKDTIMKFRKGLEGLGIL